MPATTKRTRRLSDDELDQLLALTKESDSVELKLTVPDSGRHSALTRLDMDPLGAQVRQVYFFDTPDLACNRQGVVVRARRVQGRGDDSVVKLRPVVPHELPADVRRSKNLVVEVDAMPGGYVCSASLKGVTSDVKRTAMGERRISKLFSKEQRAFYTANAPDGLELDDLAILGPITLLKLKFPAPGHVRRMVAELWFYPDGSRLLELSTKCSPEETFQVAVEARAYLSERGVDLGGRQQTKTKTALEYFSRQLETEAAAAKA